MNESRRAVVCVEPQPALTRFLQTGLRYGRTNRVGRVAWACGVDDAIEQSSALGGTSPIVVWDGDHPQAVGFDGAALVDAIHDFARRDSRVTQIIVLDRVSPTDRLVLSTTTQATIVGRGQYAQILRVVERALSLPAGR